MGLSVHKYLSSSRKSNPGRSPIFFRWTNPEDQDLESPSSYPDSPTSEPELAFNFEWLVSYRQLCREVDQDWAELDREIWVSLNYTSQPVFCSERGIFSIFRDVQIPQ